MGNKGEIMTPKKEKTFVLDTNVILHDSSCIYHFQENDIVIPITVLEELDQFKKGNSSLNYHARNFFET
jgi:PhoH-like ATPase